MKIPDDLAAELDAEAERRGMPAPWLLAKILRDGLERPERDPPSYPDPPEISTR
jgi:hypothetical protein